MNERKVEGNIIVRDLKAVRDKVFEIVEPYSGIAFLFMAFAQAYFALMMSNALGKIFGSPEVFTVIIVGFIIALARASK